MPLVQLPTALGVLSVWRGFGLYLVCTFHFLYFEKLKSNPLYAILSGFEVGDTPGVRTFYDFINHL